MQGQPRVLVVGQPFERTSGGGITLCNLFEGWPRDRLAAAVASDRDLAFDICDRYYALGASEITWAWPLSLVRRTETPASKPTVPRPSPGHIPESAARPQPGFAKRAFRTGLDALGAEDALRGTHLSDQLRQWILEFKPDLVYSQLSDLPTMTLVSEILDATGLPFALHVMDDWPSSMYRRGAFSGIVRGRADRALVSLLRRSAARMAIGDAMAEEYLRRYGLPFVAIQNSVDVAKQSSLADLHRLEYARPAGSPMSVVYAGRVGRANADSVLAVAKVVVDMVSAGVPLRLLVYTGSVNHPAVERMSRLEGVELRAAVPYDHMPALLESSDVLLMPLDFDEEAVRFARLSMPTKIPEYMAAGRPVLTYAPRGCAAAEYAREGCWSLLVDRPDPASLRAALSSLVADPEGREAMGAAGRVLAGKRHDASEVRAVFAAQLARAASGQSTAPGRAGS